MPRLKLNDVPTCVSYSAGTDNGSFLQNCSADLQVDYAPDSSPPTSFPSVTY